MNVESHYDLLGITRSASATEIKLAYRRLAMQWHPDRNPENLFQAESQFKKIKSAYETLSDENRRRFYDDSHKFSNVHGSTRNHTEASTPSPIAGRDAVANYSITLEQALSGCVVEIPYTTEDVCYECKGDGDVTPGYKCKNCGGTGKKTYSDGFTCCRKCSGRGHLSHSKCTSCRGKGLLRAKRTIKVNLPHGVYDGCIFTIQKKGGKGFFGGPDGSLVLTVSIKSLGKIRIAGGDLIVPLKVDFLTAILGGAVKARTPTGFYEVAIPELTRAGDLIHLENAGLRAKNCAIRGRMSFEISIDLPRKLSKVTDEIRMALHAFR